MSDISPADTQFLQQLNEAIAKNMANEQFGVTELADAMSMSRSNLLRKVKKLTSLPVNQLIREARLKRAMELLQNSSSNVSEVSHQVGFNSTSYFIKCFREYYGYPPGEAGKRATTEPLPTKPARSLNTRKLIWIGVAALIATFIFQYIKRKPDAPEDRSIVVLPFKNESNDSTNVYFVNGLMESTLNNLQKIEDLRVLSRTSSEKYRNTTKSIPEMAKELDVRYFIEGSGQKIGNQILLTIQLIEGPNDKHIWAKQYRRETEDIFALQQEIARDVADEIEVAISPDEKQRIEKIPTENLQAYDSFLKGIDLLNKGGDNNLEASLVQFNDAIRQDSSFALAYACAGISCYWLDYFKADLKHIDALGNYADKALLYDPKLAESLTAKAMFFIQKKQYSEALPYLEKGLKYSPNSTQVLNLLTDFYFMYLPNTGKYLEYALKGLRLDASGDSVSKSYTYLRLGNALAQTGFIDQSLIYLGKSIAYNSKNPFTPHLRAFVVYAKDRNLGKVKQSLIQEFRKDTTRFDILQDIGKVCYYLKEYDSSYVYYKRFVRMRETLKLDVYRHENMMIALAYEKAGETERAKAFMDDYRQYLESDQTAYKDLGWCAYYDYKGDTGKAMERLRRFSKQDNIQYWIILFMRQQPMPGSISKLPECKKLMDEIEAKFWANHEKLKVTLEDKGLL
ncbi:MAG TPA: helix-turn-helix domain-containing protein [Cyclobacteriaceae bacterium]|nr:helix-turn-helix domain-containing protein [Cyclobacteriaceae bacterium]HMV08748.1 helix-turn-helix domain-containing protein [Cyclobacteriaceae bacterium]HMV90206.1 helix-turn-helix domain-containing protein [Cyclobacteriaceae bacterium]HMW99893.1 helix-turn-helix domain-containing protein [Cyclobacteriaceae bacterium]HMX49244.1 helix-turn-helix domain-containing protein [Cyclobacteriaceae bacterium]